MLLGKVVGEVWATVKDPKLDGAKFLIVRQVDLDGKPLPNFLVAVDSLESGIGETVLVAQGSSARQTDRTQDRPVDAVIMAIVDRLDVAPDKELEKDYQARAREIEKRIAQRSES